MASRKLHVGAAFLAVALSCALALGLASASAVVGLDASGSQSAGGSTVGIRVDAPLPQAGKDAQGNDSNLGIRVASLATEDVDVVFVAQGRTYYTARVGFGGYAVAPPIDPVWSWQRDPQYLLGLTEGEDADPAFALWCTDAAGTVAYDFSRAVAPDRGEDGRFSLTLYAGWKVGREVAVTLDAAGGMIEDPETGNQAATMVVTRNTGSTYMTLPAPKRAGYAFAGWRYEAEGASPVPVDAATKVGDVCLDDHTLRAAWEPVAYFIDYYNNPDGAGGGPVFTQGVTYADPDDRFMAWDDLKGPAHGFAEPSGCTFAGWSDRIKGQEAGGSWYWEDTAIDPDLADAAGAHVPLYAQWEKTVEEGPFTVTFVYGNGEPDREVSVEKGAKVPEPDAPKRTGYQFGGWYSDGLFANKWPFDAQVSGAMTLYARWDLRLDVTVPVEVGFAVDAESREVTTPEADLYAIKSRTVAPVQVEEMAVISDEDEIEEFFNLGDDAEGWQGALQDTALWVWKTGPGGASSWTTDFSKEPDGAGGLSFALSLANETGERGEYAKRRPDGTETVISGWRNAKTLAGNESFRLEAFNYGSTAFDEGWQGGDPSVSLPLKLGMGISSDLEVETALDGPRPLTHLIVTVSAQG